MKDPIKVGIIGVGGTSSSTTVVPNIDLISM